MSQNYIPGISTMVVFLGVLCALVWKQNIFDQEDLRCSYQKFIDLQNSMSPWPNVKLSDICHGDHKFIDYQQYVTVTKCLLLVVCHRDQMFMYYQ